MKVALLSSLSQLIQPTDFLNQHNYQVTHIIAPMNIPTNIQINLPPNTKFVSIYEAINLYRSGQIDAVFLFRVKDPDYSRFYMLSSIRILKMSGIENLYLLANYFWDSLGADNGPKIVQIWKLDSEKYFVDYIETNLIDSCNLNCRACTHFASLFEKDSIYPVELFKRDCRELSKKIELAYFRLLGGEPFLLKNLDEYLDTARKYFPNAFIILVSNGLLIPTISDKIFESMKRNKIIVDMTQYPPTIKMKDRIESVLNSKGIMHIFGREVDTFRKQLRHEPGLSDINKSLSKCTSTTCTFLRDGKIYKCPTEALIYKYAEKFTDKHIPPTMPADIYSENFLEMLAHIMVFPIQMCGMCSENPPSVQWSVNNNPTADDF